MPSREINTCTVTGNDTGATAVCQECPKGMTFTGVGSWEKAKHFAYKHTCLRSDEVSPETGSVVDDCLRIIDNTYDGVLSHGGSHPITVSGDLREIFPEDDLFESNHEIEACIRRQLPALELEKTLFDSEYSCFFCYTDTLARAQTICNYIARAAVSAYSEVAEKRIWNKKS